MNNPHVYTRKIVCVLRKAYAKKNTQDRKRIENPYDRFKSEGVAGGAFEQTLAGRNVAAPNPQVGQKLRINLFTFEWIFGEYTSNV